MCKYQEYNATLIDWIFGPIRSYLNVVEQFSLDHEIFTGLLGF